MLVFLDESGDGGMKLDRGSSPYFLVALVVFSDNDEASRCDDAIAAHRENSGLARDFEFHCAQNSARQREAFLRVVYAFDFRTHVFALNKRAATGPGFQYTDSVYKWTARTAFENAKSSLVEAKVVLDGSGNRDFRRELTAYLRRQINGRRPSVQPIRDIRIQSARQNNLLQLADYVASMSARAITQKADGERLRRMYLRPHEASFRVWPR